MKFLVFLIKDDAAEIPRVEFYDVYDTEVEARRIADHSPYRAFVIQAYTNWI